MPKKHANSITQHPQQSGVAAQSSNNVAIFHAQQFSGPMPPPEMLRQYEEVLPGLANRIVTLAENQSSHRIRLERRVTTSNIWRAHFGQLFAFLIAVCGIVAGTYLIINNKSAEGIAAILTPITGIAGVFVWRTKRQRNELSSKNRSIN